MTQTKLFAVAALLAGCATELESTETAALAIPVSVPVGDPIKVVSAPPVNVDAIVGDTLDLAAVTPACPTTCSLTWRDPDHGIPRYGGVILGYGATLSVAANVAGSSRVSLEYCQRTSARFSRCITTMVYVTTHAAEAAARSGSWPYPVPDGCVAISSTQCRTNVGHYDVIEAEASLDRNMTAAGFTKGYSSVCRSNLGYTKGSTKVCYRVGIVEDANFQVVGSQWNGFRG